MVNVKSGAILFLGVGVSFCLAAKVKDNQLTYSAKNLKEFAAFDTDHNSRISFLQDRVTGKKFLLKQEKRSEPHWYIVVAREALGAHVAHSADIPANQVEIIPAHAAFPGKQNKARPATLHSVVPGVKVNRAKKLRPLRICIQQYIKDSVPKSQWGLTHEVVRSMALHRDLARLAALDTFIANGDRHRGNFFYDEASDRFIAIDLESSFKRDLACFGAKFMSSLLKDKSKLSQLSTQEIEGLLLYRETLKRLVSKHTPSSLYQKFLTFTIKAGIMPPRGRGPVAARICTYKTSIEKNYASCLKLLLLLDQFMVKRSKQENKLKNSKIRKARL